MDPYRDELMALRADNERLRRLVDDRRHRRGQLVAALFVEFGLAVGTMVVLYQLLPLLNAPSDGRFFLGASLAVLLFAIDVIAIFVIAARFSRS
jgi:hypothetical protein